MREGGMELEDVFLLLGILNPPPPPPPLSLPRHLSLSLPEEEEAALKGTMTKSDRERRQRKEHSLQTLHMQGTLRKKHLQKQKNDFYLLVKICGAMKTKVKHKNTDCSLSFKISLSLCVFMPV